MELYGTEFLINHLIHFNAIIGIMLDMSYTITSLFCCLKKRSQNYNGVCYSWSHCANSGDARVHSAVVLSGFAFRIQN